MFQGDSTPFPLPYGHIMLSVIYILSDDIFRINYLHCETDPLIAPLADKSVLQRHIDTFGLNVKTAISWWPNIWQLSVWGPLIHLIAIDTFWIPHNSF